MTTISKIPFAVQVNRDCVRFVVGHEADPIVVAIITHDQAIALARELEWADRLIGQAPKNHANEEKT
jgi:hypothetical protein